jgi:TetR/AcrR family transcriptional regulator
MSVLTTPSDRRARRRAQTAAAILDAAERLFLTRGFEATTIEQLAEQADVAVGSIYGHFDSKEGVYAALLDRALELDARYCDEGWAGGTDPVGRLVGLGEGYLRFAREYPGHFRLFRFPPAGGPTAGPAASASARVAERVRSEVARMAGAMREATAQGTVRSVDPDRAAVFLWAAWDGVIAAHVQPGNMGLSDCEFEEVLALGREVLALGLLRPHETTP